MELPLLKDISIIFGLAVVVLWFCSHLRVPIIVGFILTGIISGPHGLKLIEHIEEVETVSKIGIMFLLFTIGLELPLKKLKQLRRYFLLGGSLQVFLTIFVGFFIAQMVERPLGESIFLGFLLSMSSTAIVLKTLESKDAVDTPEGHLDFSILIFQDIIAIPMLLLIPLLSQTEENFKPSLFFESLIALIIIFMTVVFAIKIVSKILYYVARTRVRELFSLTVLTICFLVAWVTSSFGLSLAIGAFLAGLIISESEFRHEAIGNIIPLQDVFSSMFFVSIGMLLNIQFLYENLLLVITLAIGALLMKAAIVAITAKILKLPLRIMILSAIALCQIGEFAFVLIRAGMDIGLATSYLNQLFLSVALITMALSPTLIAHSEQIADLILHKKLRKEGDKKESTLKDHVIAVGYGVAGRYLVSALKNENIPYVIIEMNPDTVNEEKMKGEPIYYGDASHNHILHYVGIENAKAVAIMINDPNALKRIVSHVRNLNPSIFLIVRTRYIKDVDSLSKHGATEVVPDEFGSSIEILTRVLKQYKVDEEKINQFASSLQVGNNIGIS